MSTERKKVEPKEVVKMTPKKRVEPAPLVKLEVKETKKVEPKIVENPIQVEEVKVKRAENKYVKIALDAKGEERSSFTTKVKNGEIKYAYYATDGDKGYHYYLVIKK